MPATVSFCGRPVTETELGLIRDIIHDFPTLSVAELSKTICELLDWRRPSGGLKNHECYLFLQQLKDRGWLPSLPDLRVTSPRGPRQIKLDAQSEPDVPVLRSLDDCLPLALDLISDGDGRILFRQYIQRYHYLGYKVPCGAQLRYFVRSRPLSNRIVACMLFTSAALKIAPRDRWIGWSDQARKCNLTQIINNSRFLILPWVQVQQLASKILSLVVHQLPDDWLDSYCVKPLLLESFVDPERFSGTCYRAANWIHAGTTQGRGRMDRNQDVERHIKEIFVYPLHPRAREILCRIPESHPSSMRPP
jgi:Druantia protein DruA